MRILVPIKQVADPDHASRIRVSEDGKSVDISALERKTNPFDEYALEASLRLTEDGRAPRQRIGEVIAATLGPKETESMLRSALATGADRAIRVPVEDNQLDGNVTAHVVAELARRNHVDLVILGKQTVDGDGNEVAQRVSVLLGWPCATFAATIVERDDGTLTIDREVDGGVDRLHVLPPAIISVDLRIVASNSVRSKMTPAEHNYPPGVRFASLPAILQSKRKPLEILDVEALCVTLEPSVIHSSYYLPSVRTAGKKVNSVEELIACLVTEAKVL